MENKTTSGIQEFVTVLGIATAIAGAMTLLALVPPVSNFYRWLQDHDHPYTWPALVSGIISGVLSYYRIRESKKEAA